MDQTAGQTGAYMNRWYDGASDSHSGISQDYYNMAQAMHCAYGNNMAGRKSIAFLYFYN